MNKKNQGIEVKLSVIAISAILVASLFVMGGSRFIPDAMAQNFTDQTGAAIGGAANQTGAAAGGAANQTGAAAGGAANQTGAAAAGAAAGGEANQTGAAAGGEAGGAAAGGATNATGAMVQIPQAAMTTIMDDIETVRGAVDEGDTEAVDALDNIDMQLRTAAGLPLADAAADDEEAAADDEEAAADDEEAAADDEDAAAADDEEEADDEGTAAE
jgi:hypothetical protein